MVVALGAPTKSPPGVPHVSVSKKRCVQVASPVVAAAPLPRRYVQIGLQFNNKLFNTHTIKHIEFEYLVPPINNKL